MFYTWYMWQMSVHLQIENSKVPRLYWIAMNHAHFIKYPIL